MDFNVQSRVRNDPWPEVRIALGGMTAPPPRG